MSVPFQLVCDLSDLENDSSLLLNLLHQFQSVGNDSDWKSVIQLNNYKLLFTLYSHYNSLYNQIQNENENYNNLLYSHYIAALNLLFVSLSIEEIKSAEILAEQGLINQSIILSHSQIKEDEPVIHLKVQILSMLLSSCNPSTCNLDIRKLPFILQQLCTLSIHPFSELSTDAQQTIFKFFVLLSHFSPKMVPKMMQTCICSQARKALVEHALSIVRSDDSTRLALMAMQYVDVSSRLQQPLTNSKFLTVDALNEAARELFDESPMRGAAADSTC